MNAHLYELSTNPTEEAMDVIGKVVHYLVNAVTAIYALTALGTLIAVCWFCLGCSGKVWEQNRRRVFNPYGDHVR